MKKALTKKQLQAIPRSEWRATVSISKWRQEVARFFLWAAGYRAGGNCLPEFETNYNSPPR